MKAKECQVLKVSNSGVALDKKATNSHGKWSSPWVNRLLKWLLLYTYKEVPLYSYNGATFLCSSWMDFLLIDEGLYAWITPINFDWESSRFEQTSRDSLFFIGKPCLYYMHSASEGKKSRKQYLNAMVALYAVSTQLNPQGKNFFHIYVYISQNLFLFSSSKVSNAGATSYVLILMLLLTIVNIKQMIHIDLCILNVSYGYKM